MQTQLSLRRVLEQLGQAGLMQPEAVGQASQTALADAPTHDNPWYIKLLVGISAWLAAGLLGFFLGAAGLIDTNEALLASGAALVIVAIAIRWLGRQSIFWGQLAFAFSLAGQGCLLIGMGQQTESTRLTAQFLIVLELVMFVVYPDMLHRLISLLAISAAICYLLIDYQAQEGIHLLTFLAALGVVWVWQAEWQFSQRFWSEVRTPLGYGFALTLCGLCVPSFIPEFKANLWWLSTLGLVLVLLYLGHQILRDLDLSWVSAAGLWGLGALALLCIPAYETPGILAAVLLLLLSYWRRNLLLMGLAIVFLLAFLSAYYYNLEVTLLIKSWILMGTGSALLAARLVSGRWQVASSSTMSHWRDVG